MGHTCHSWFKTIIKRYGEEVGVYATSTNGIMMRIIRGQKFVVRAKRSKVSISRLTQSPTPPFSYFSDRWWRWWLFPELQPLTLTLYYLLSSTVCCVFDHFSPFSSFPSSGLLCFCSGGMMRRSQLLLLESEVTVQINIITKELHHHQTSDHEIIRTWCDVEE